VTKNDTIGQEILVSQRSRGDAWQEAKKGDVWRLFIHGAQWPSALRSAPPPCATARGLPWWTEPDALRAGGPLARRAAGVAAAGEAG
jgi:hypothetical protein